MALDDIRFRPRHHDLVLLRPCAHRGTGEFVSSLLATRADVGHALGSWRLLHAACDAQDPAESQTPRLGEAA
jgi:hypothetical protein